MNDNDKAKLMRPRPVRESASEMTEIVLPNDADVLNALLGGRLMHWIDLAGAMAAHRHSRQHVVTASIDHLDFLVPVRVGDSRDPTLLGQSCLPHFDGGGGEGWVENYRAEERSEHIPLCLSLSSEEHSRPPRRRRS